MNPTDPLQWLPHRPPFVFVDRIVELQPGRSATGVKRIEAGDWVLQGHFPDHPLLPGVIVVEALAQVAGVALNSPLPGGGRRTHLAAIRSLKFRRPIVAGEEILLQATKTSQLGDLNQFAVRASVGGAVAAEGEIVLGWVG